MGLIATQFFKSDGTKPSFAAAAVGDQAAVSDKHFLVVKNTGASATVTVAVPGTLVNGVAAPDTTVTVASTTGSPGRVFNEVSSPSVPAPSTLTEATCVRGPASTS